MGLIGLVYTKYSSLVSALALSTLFHFLFSLQILFCLHPSFLFASYLFVCIVTGFGFLFASDLFCLHPIFFVCIVTGFGFLIASDLFCLHPIFFVCILSFLFASYLFCLHPIFFVCSKPFFIVLTLVGTVQTALPASKAIA